MTCVLDDDEHHVYECGNCNGEFFGTDNCKPRRCPDCEKTGHVSSYLRVLKGRHVSNKYQIVDGDRIDF